MTYTATPPWLARCHMMATRRGGWKGWGYGHRGGFFMGPGPFFGGKPKVSRGDVRAAILHLLAEEPMHGYQIMQELSERTDGVWQPSPGSIYPTLQQLEDEGLVRVEERDGKKVYTLTDQGRSAVGSEGDAPPWERFGSDIHDGLFALREVGFQVGAAVLEEARRGIYQILGDDDQPG